MPDDLLRFIGGPTPYSSWWLWIALGLLAVVIVWCAVVFVWTLPAERLRAIPAVRSMHAKILRRRFARAISSVDERFRSGDLSAAEASAKISRTLRSFLYQATGTRAQYMHVDDIEASGLAKAAPLISALNDAQFNTASPVDVSRTGSAAEELIRSWA